MQQQIDAVMNMMKDAMILGTGSIMIDRRNIMSGPRDPGRTMNHALDAQVYASQYLQRPTDRDMMAGGAWDGEVLRHSNPNRVEVTPDLIRIFDWAYKNRIEIFLKHDDGMAKIRFKRGERYREICAPRLAEIYAIVGREYRQIFAELRCPELNLEG